MPEQTPALSGQSATTSARVPEQRLGVCYRSSSRTQLVHIGDDKRAVSGISSAHSYALCGKWLSVLWRPSDSTGYYPPKATEPTCTRCIKEARRGD